MRTDFLLMAQYDGRAIIPLDLVRRDYFGHLTVEQFKRKIGRGEIALPIVRIEASQKSAQGVALEHLASWIDARKEAAQRECQALNSGKRS